MSAKESIAEYFYALTSLSMLSRIHIIFSKVTFLFPQGPQGTMRKAPSHKLEFLVVPP